MQKTPPLTAMFIALICPPIFGQQQVQKFSSAEVLEDMDYLYHSLIEAHHNIYAYVSKEEFERNYQAVRGSIDQDSLSTLEVTTAFQQVISAANNGHTEIDFPITPYATYVYGGGSVFPFEIAFQNDACLIRKNFSRDQEIPTGAEVLKINGQSMESILGQLYPQVSAERRYFKNAKIEMYSFPRLYWQLFGEQQEFEVVLKVDDEQKVYNLEAISALDEYEMQRSEVLSAQMQLKFFDKTAYLNPGDFAGDEAAYQRFIDSSFTVVREQKSQHLIIDLRNNRGGNDSFGDYLVSYFADEAFSWNSAFTLKTSQLLKDHTKANNDTTDPYFQEILSRANGEVYPYAFEESQPQPAEKRFKGKVYVLVNRQSYSQSAVTAAQIQDLKLGVIVGEETGEFPSLYAARFGYVLPNTGILVNLSKGYIVRVNGSTKAEGVIPDIQIQDHLLDDEDEILQAILRQLNG